MGVFSARFVERRATNLDRPIPTAHPGAAGHAIRPRRGQPVERERPVAFKDFERAVGSLEGRASRSRDTAPLSWASMVCVYALGGGQGRREKGRRGCEARRHRAQELLPQGVSEILCAGPG